MTQAGARFVMNHLLQDDETLVRLRETAERAMWDIPYKLSFISSPEGMDIRMNAHVVAIVRAVKPPAVDPFWPAYPIPVN